VNANEPKPEVLPVNGGGFPASCASHSISAEPIEISDLLIVSAVGLKTDKPIEGKAHSDRTIAPGFCGASDRGIFLLAGGGFEHEKQVGALQLAGDVPHVLKESWNVTCWLYDSSNWSVWTHFAM
jgi:hypothetical protein